MPVSSTHQPSKGLTRLPASAPFRLALWLAISTALIELGVRLAAWRFSRRPLWAGIDLVWMAPLANLLWLGGAALLAWAANRAWPRRIGLGEVVGIIAFPAILSLLWLHPNFYRNAMVLLALGLAVQAGRFAARHPAAIARLNRRGVLVTVPLMMFVVTGVLGLDRWQEWRALRDLPAGRAAMPNVLLLVLDTVRSFNLSAYGYSRRTSPQLARLTRESVRFDRAFSTSGWTLPSHASMFTGRYADALATGPRQPMPDDVPTLAGAMAQAGYATGGFVGNLSFAGWEYGLSRGFMHYEDYPVTPITFFTSTALGRTVFAEPRVRYLIGYMDKPDRKRAARVRHELFDWLDDIGERPFFAFVNFFDAHHPYLPPAPFNGMFTPPPTPRYRAEPLEFGDLGPEELVRTQGAYDGSIAYMDQEVARLVAELAARGLLDRTLLIITSDHGEHWGDHERLAHGNSFYRQLLQVPLLIRHPGMLPGGTRIRRAVTLRDLPATILDVADVPNGGRFPGWSLAALVADESATLSPIVSGRALHGLLNAQSLISEGMHYIRTASGEELYDLEQDSLEVNSLVGTERGDAILPRLRARLDSINAAVPPVPR